MFLLGASGAAAVTSHTATALHRPAGRGSIQDIEHVVILMQENRSFDHYFGSLRGVRGFADPRPVTLPSGKPVWAQRRADRDGGEIAWPFRLDYNSSNARCFTGLDHSWKDSQARWRNWDVWAEQKGPLTMAHLTRADIPYYYALADAFTICDAYHCSLQGPTGPNRLYHFTGTSGLSVGQEGEYCVTNGGSDPNPGADMAKDDATEGLPWRTYAGRLEEAGISWRVYQELANYSDNPLGYFKEFRKLDPTSSRYRRGRAYVDWIDGIAPADPEKTQARHLIAAFAADVAADRLPQVSWIVPMMQMSEHPDAPVPFGEVLIGNLVAALAANPKVWAKTAFILNYDENDGFFDHIPAPMPAIAPRYGASNVDVRSETYQGEPVGLGPRVPMMVISPWTRGGWVNSQMFDHTSVLRFLEKRFGVAEPNISPWRRAICGDLTSIFDFDVSQEARLDTHWAKALPSVAGYIAETEHLCKSGSPPQIATSKGVPAQEPGTRPARALPYRFAVEPSWSDAGLTLRFVNEGNVGVVFGVQDETAFPGWRYFTVAAGSRLEEAWPLRRDRPHALVVRGPNGFHREYRGPGGAARIEATVDWRDDGRVGMLHLADRDGTAATVTMHCAHTGRQERLPVAAETQHPLALSDHRWYDVMLVASDGTRLRLAGHVETGEPGVSEPVAAYPHPL
ncbi:phospholipase C, phosphocholine-specific [Sphingomonas sp. H39-1-10]|uniref:phosphocholine-specific phospholipase C n=1 Tax=Sphingomonas pollutisoli TaxID=3030829 RepID=UPI0023B9491E|nr:phospholipase C, phosphocholine-specific [Sphingomonas pollutisoli]MDF0488908.1 phospholipase C, phosphocholine-specific [Sphingomonas pollutisoli]